MIIHNITERSELGQPWYRLLISDLHLGSANSDMEEIVRELDAAKSIGARVLINGDVFDVIGPTDKRFDLSVLHPSIAQEKDLARAIVSMGKDLLWPYRKVIDVIGIGNHCEAWIKYNHGDPVRRLIEELSSEGDCKIKHGSFWGYIKTAFVVPEYRRRPKHRLLYLHGTGGDSPVTKGTIDFNRKGRHWHYDCLTFGHKHNLVCAVDQIADVADNGHYQEHRQLNLQTGSFYRNYRQLADESVLDYSYAASKAHPPKPLGGVYLCLRPILDPLSGSLTIRQDFMSDVVAPWNRGKKVSRRQVGEQDGPRVCRQGPP